MQAYLDIVKRVLTEGKEKFPVRKNAAGEFIPVDGGVKTIGLPNVLFSHDMAEGFPLLTTKKMAVKSMAIELEGFIKGITDKKWFKERGCNIWNSWASKLHQADLSNDEWHIQQKYINDLGPLGYSWQWRNFGKPYKPIPQIPIRLKGLQYLPTVANVACWGNTSKYKDLYGEKKWQSLKNIWRNMINRCYDENNNQYHIYGNNGVYVDDEWLVCEFFLRDAISIPNYKFKESEWDDYSLDKDFYDEKKYSLKTCIWASKYHQAQHTQKQCYFKAIAPNKEIFYHYNQTKFAKDFGLISQGISSCLNNTQTSHKGWKFVRLDNKNEVYVDQLKNIVDTLKTNPYERRMICSAFNPNVLHISALPPCHLMWNVCVYEDEINLFWAQRSCDLMLGVPFNIASYGLLLMILAKESGLRPGNLSGMLVDCHIYENQIDGAKEQIERQPKTLPTVYITSDGIWDWDHTKFRLENYNPCEKIDFGKVAV